MKNRVRKSIRDTNDTVLCIELLRGSYNDLELVMWDGRNSVVTIPSLRPRIVDALTKSLRGAVQIESVEILHRLGPEVEKPK